MVQVTQTEDDIKIVIELNRLITRRPDVVVLPRYIKFNNPPIFFERHLTNDIDEVASFCRIFKSEARIILVKKHKGIWPELFEKFSKEELFKKRLEISDQIVERNKERDRKSLERYENKRRTEIDKEIKRETAMRERVKQFEENACRETLMVGVRKETHSKQPKSEAANVSNASKDNVTSASTAAFNTHSHSTPPMRPMASLRSGGAISVNFSNFNYVTPKRESQEGVPRPFVVHPKNMDAKQFKDEGEKTMDGVE